MFPLPCVIFAGGKSSRMGRNKALLPFGSASTLTAYQYARLSPLFESTFVSVKEPSLFPDTLPVIVDDPAFNEAAPTAGFIAAFRALRTERIFVIGVDTPFVDEKVIAALLEADTPGHDAVIARTQEGMHPLCGIYHRRLLPRFEAMAASRDHRLGKMLRDINTLFVDFKNEQAFTNLNHPHEYAAAVEKAGK